MAYRQYSFSELEQMSQDPNRKQKLGTAFDLIGTISRGGKQQENMQRYGIKSDAAYNRLVDLGSQMQNWQNNRQAQYSPVSNNGLSVPSQQTQNKFYKTVVNGRTYYDAIPDVGNVPYGYTPVAAGEVLANSANVIDQKVLELARSVAPTESGAGQSGIVMVDGVPWNAEDYQRKLATESDPNMENIGTAERPLYVPRSARFAQLPLLERRKAVDAQARANLGAGATPAQIRAEYQRLWKEGQAFQAERRNVPQLLQQGGVSQAGTAQFNTGNAKTDDFLNNVWLPLIEAELTKNPEALYNSDEFKRISEQVEQTWRPIYDYEFGQAKQTYERSQQEIQAQQSAYERQSGLKLSRGLADIERQQQRTTEDIGTQQQRVARNFTEAMQDSKDALAARNLTFGGTRLKQEAQLGEERRLAEAALEQQKARTLEDLQTRRRELETDVPAELQEQQGQYGRRLGELEQGFGRQTKELGGLFTQKQQEALSEAEAERTRKLQLGGQLLNYSNLLS